jgi:hypothetical protein
MNEKKAMFIFFNKEIIEDDGAKASFPFFVGDNKNK